MEAGFLTRHPRIKDGINFLFFIIAVLLGTVLINTFVFRTFNVEGHSMDYTLHQGDRLIVNRIPTTIAMLKNTSYIPSRGDVIVFKNPRFVKGERTEFIVKRVIGLPGERVVVKDGILKIYNTTHPDGFEPDVQWQKNGIGPQSPSSGNVDMVVGDKTLFVAGDNRIANHSYDSRLGLGTVPLFDVIGPVSLRIFPFTKMGGV